MNMDKLIRELEGIKATIAAAQQRKDEIATLLGPGRHKGTDFDLFVNHPSFATLVSPSLVKQYISPLLLNKYKVRKALSSRVRIAGKLKGGVK